MKKLKTIKASVLVFSLIILFVGLAAAIGIASSVLISQRNSLSTSSSVQSFQVSDSGAEIFLDKLKDADSTAPLDDLRLSCDPSTGVITGNIGADKEFKITALKEDGSKIADCNTTPVSEIARIKSVGSYKNTSRAVEMAVAAAGDEMKGCSVCHVGPDTGWKTCSLVLDGENVCEDGNGCQLYAVRYEGNLVDYTVNPGHGIFFQQEGTHAWARYSETGKNGDSTSTDIWDPGNNFEMRDDYGTESSPDNVSARKQNYPNSDQEWDVIICD